MRKVKVNIRYQSLYALILLIVFIAMLCIYYLFTKNADGLPLKALTWGFLIFAIYYFFIQNIKIIITRNRLLLCKPTNRLCNKTIDIQKIKFVELRKGFIFSKVIVHYNEKDTVVLYPEDCITFIRLIKKLQQPRPKRWKAVKKRIHLPMQQKGTSL